MIGRLDKDTLRKYRRIADLALERLTFLVTGKDKEKLKVTKSGRTVTLDVDFGELASGQPVELGSNATHLLWRAVGETEWNNLIALSEIRGEDGDDGDDGDDGANASIAVGNVTTGAAGSSVVVTNSGTAQNAILDFTIPRGDTGSKGNAGNAATISVGNVTNLGPTDPATVSNSGSLSAAVFDFGIPVGPTGDTGPPGASLTPKADWVSGLDYDVRDVVRNGSASYVAGIDHTASPTNEPGVGIDWSAHWMLLVEDGEPGDNGENGADGAVVLLAADAGSSATAAVELQEIFDSSLYHSYQIRIGHMRPSSDGVALQLGLMTGASLESIGSAYTGFSFSNMLANNGGDAHFLVTDYFQLVSTLGNVSSGWTEGVKGFVIEVYPHGSDGMQVIEYRGMTRTNAPGMYHYTGSGGAQNATDCDGIRLRMSSGNIADWDIAVYGYKR